MALEVQAKASPPLIGGIDFGSPPVEVAVEAAASTAWLGD